MVYQGRALDTLPGKELPLATAALVNAGKVYLSGLLICATRLMSSDGYPVLSAEAVTEQSDGFFFVHRA